MNEQSQNRWMVCVRCFTFNHAAYIVDALDGFCMQETNFPFVCTIVDDASTDGEQGVIKKYLQENFDFSDSSIVRNEETVDYVMTFARHKDNRNCFFAVFYLKYNHFSIKKSKFPYISEWYNNVKYIAFCEGDDYWIYPKKLQLQVDFLDNHKEFGMCYTKFNILLSKENVMLYDVYETISQRYKIVSDLSTWIELTPYAAPMSWVARSDLWYNTPPIPSSDGTFLYFANFLDQTLVHCMEGSPMVVYRIVEESASHTYSVIKKYKRAKALFYSQIELIDYYKNKIENINELKCRIRRKFYQNYFFLIMLNRDRDEFSKAVVFLDTSISFQQKLIIICSKMNFLIEVLLFFWEHKNKFKRILRIDTRLLREYKHYIILNKTRYPHYYNELNR